MVKTAKLTLITVVVGFEIGPRLMDDLRALGVGGYTIGKVDGRGHHGARTAGIADASSLRVEMLVAPALAEGILELVATKYADQPVIAYLQDNVRAMPAKNFA